MRTQGTTTNNEGTLTARKVSQNWARHILATCALVATFLFGSAALAQSSTMSPENMGNFVTDTRRQIDEVDRTVHGLEQRVNNGTPCAQGMWTVPVRIAPMRLTDGTTTPQADLQACVSREPTDAQRQAIGEVLETRWRAIQGLRSCLRRQRVAIDQLQQQAADQAALIQAVEATATEARAYARQLGTWAGALLNYITEGFNRISTALTEVRQEIAGLRATVTTVQQQGDATARRLDQHVADERAARERHHFGPRASLWASTCPSGHNCWTGFTIGFGYAGKLASNGFAAWGGIDGGYVHGRSGGYDGAVLMATAGIGYQSDSNRWGVGVGAQGFMLFTAEIDGGLAFLGLGPVITGWWSPVEWANVAIEFGSMHGSLRMGPGHGEDHEAFTGRVLFTFRIH